MRRIAGRGDLQQVRPPVQTNMFQSESAFRPINIIYPPVPWFVAVSREQKLGEVDLLRDRCGLFSRAE
jgi:hypothetical protein